MKPHKHAKEIIAWANGVAIQFKARTDNHWYSISSPSWDEDLEYRASLSEVEGKPVFQNDLLWHPDYAVAQHVFDFCFEPPYKIEDWSWDKPKPKTITVELLREDAEELVVFNHSSAALRRFADVCKEALKEKP